MNDTVIRELENPGNELWLSPISTWETLLLIEKGRISLQCDAREWIQSVFEKIPFYEAPLNHHVAMYSRSIDLPHQDPADRFLAATAHIYDLTLVTADERLFKTRDISVLATR